MKTICAIVTFICVAASASAQDWKKMDVDELFESARKKAFAGNYSEAREMLAEVLQRTPDYDDARIFLARTYAWDKQYDAARRETQIVLDKSPNDEQAFGVASDIEVWDHQFEHGLKIVENALTHYPNSEDFLFKKATILLNLHRNTEASEPLARLLTINPSHSKALLLQNDLRNSAMKYSAGISYNINFFSKVFDPAHYVSVQLTRTNSWGTGIVRLNYANRFGTSGFQPEVDLYPKIANRFYAYLNYGYSKSVPFPRQRVSGEFYARLPKSFEASAGVRYLYFANFEPDAPGYGVTIYTASLTRYFKKFYVSLRPYVTQSENHFYSSYTVNLRRYFKNSDNYLSISGGFGFSPDDRRLQTLNGITTAAIQVLNSQRVGLFWQQSLRNNFFLMYSFDFIRQEAPFENEDHIGIVSTMLGFKKRF